MISRRSLLGLFAGLPFVGKAVAESKPARQPSAQRPGLIKYESPPVEAVHVNDKRVLLVNGTGRTVLAKDILGIDISRIGPDGNYHWVCEASHGYRGIGAMALHDAAPGEPVLVRLKHALCH